MSDDSREWAVALQHVGPWVKAVAARIRQPFVVAGERHFLLPLAAEVQAGLSAEDGEAVRAEAKREGVDLLLADLTAYQIRIGLRLASSPEHERPMRWRLFDATGEERAPAQWLAMGGASVEAPRGAGEVVAPTNYTVLTTSRTPEQGVADVERYVEDCLVGHSREWTAMVCGRSGHVAAVTLIGGSDALWGQIRRGLDGAFEVRKDAAPVSRWYVICHLPNGTWPPCPSEEVGALGTMRVVILAAGEAGVPSGYDGADAIRLVSMGENAKLNAERVVEALRSMDQPVRGTGWRVKAMGVGAWRSAYEGVEA